MAGVFDVDAVSRSHSKHSQRLRYCREGGTISVELRLHKDIKQYSQVTARREQGLTIALILLCLRVFGVIESQIHAQLIGS